ncbi:MAG: PAS domain-containing protein [Chromatiales bacterium]|jgi:hypothetical protein|nr:PAS domain-containing protein [Chromatiales bacterium]
MELLNGSSSAANNAPPREKKSTVMDLHPLNASTAPKNWRGYTVCPWESFLQRASTWEGALEWVHPDDREHYESVRIAALRNTTGYGITTRIVPQDGQIRYVHEVADVVLDVDGNLAQTAGALHDVTEFKQNEAR